MRFRRKDGIDAGSLFAGVGGFDLACEQVGIPVKSWSEYDPSSKKQHNQRVLGTRFPNSVPHGDVAEVTYESLGKPKVITGGSPCQGFSLAGLRAGMFDHRSGLFGEFARIVREGIEDGELRYAVWENVPGALSSNQGEDFANVLSAMIGATKPHELPKFKTRRARWAGVARGELGFFAWRVIDARFFGVPQRRQRIFGVWARDESAIEVLFGQAGVERYQDTEADHGSPEQGWVWLFDTDETPDLGRMHADETHEVKLSSVLDWDVDEKYYLSERACLGILNRATRRGRALPWLLHYALWTQAGEPEEFTPGEPEDGGVPQVAMALSSNGVGTCGADDNQAQADHLPVTIAFRPQTIASPHPDNPKPGEPTPSLTASGHKDPMSVMVATATYHKVHRANHAEDYESWTFADFSSTVNEFDFGKDIRATDVVVEGEGLAFNQRDEPRFSPVGYAVQSSPGGDEQLVFVGSVPSGSAVVGFNIDPESGQGADLKARLAEASPAVLPNWTEKITDRGLRIVEAGLHPFNRLEDDFGDPDETTAPSVTVGRGEGRISVVVPGLTYRVRRLTPRECERLQGFPDGWTQLESSVDSTRYQQMGNAVAVPAAAWVMARVKAVYEGQELPGLPEVLEKFPWLRNGSSDTELLLLPVETPVDSGASSNGRSRSSKVGSSKKVIRKKSRSGSIPR